MGQENLIEKYNLRDDLNSVIKAEITGDGLEIAFNARYVLDILAVLPQGSLTLEFTDGSSAGMIKNEKESDFVYIIMPLKLES